MSYTVYKKSNSLNFYVSIVLEGGVRVQKSLGTADRKEADRKAAVSCGRVAEIETYWLQFLHTT